MGTQGDQAANTGMNDQDTMPERCHCCQGASLPPALDPPCLNSMAVNATNYPFVPEGQALSQATASNWLTLGHVSNLYFQEDGRSMGSFIFHSGQDLYLPADSHHGVSLH